MADDSAIALPNTQAQPAGQASQQQEEATEQDVEGARVSPLDLDFLVFAVPFAVLIDALDFVFEIGIVASLLMGGPLIWWLAHRGGKQVSREDILQRGQERQAAKAAARRALRRGILAFVLELIPILNLIPFWTILVLGTLRGK